MKSKRSAAAWLAGAGMLMLFATFFGVPLNPRSQVLPRSLLKAHFWGRAKFGDAVSARRLASLLDDEPNAGTKARQWWLTAAKMGDDVARLNLAKEAFYLDRNAAVARQWALLASDSSDPTIAEAARTLLRETAP